MTYRRLLLWWSKLAVIEGEGKARFPSLSTSRNTEEQTRRQTPQLCASLSLEELTKAALQGHNT